MRLFRSQSFYIFLLSYIVSADSFSGIHCVFFFFPLLSLLAASLNMFLFSFSIVDSVFLDVGLFTGQNLTFDVTLANWQWKIIVDVFF